MADSAPILYVIGIEGQIYMAKALGDELQRPVVGITVSQRAEEMLTPERRAMFQTIYSLPDFYLSQIDEIKQLSQADMDKEQAALEKELKVKSSALYTSYDRTIRPLGSFRKIRNWQLCNLRFAKKVFDEVQPAFLLSGIAIYLQHVMNDICMDRRIPCMRVAANRSGGTVMYHADGQFVGMERCFNDLQKMGDKALDAETLKEADELFDAFVKRPAPPQYSVLGSTVGLNVGLLIKKIRWALRPEHINPSERVKAVDRAYNIETPPHMIVAHAARTGFYRASQKVQRVFDSEPDMSVPFLYVPLHYAPEVSDMYFGADYDHHEGYITQLSKHIPFDCQLYVKEHICMLGRRPTSFYKNLSKLYNVKMIAPEVSSFELIKHAKANIMVTGTAGWEAYLMGKPVVAFGDVFYNFLPGVLYCDLDKDFHDKFIAYLETVDIPESERRNAYRAYHACSFPEPFVDIGETTTREEAMEIARKYARSMRAFIKTWHKEISENLPEDLRDAPLLKKVKS
ncbi:MAG: hypothetical protein H6868_08715 [Rhodospirillales bacterium]|nr:hypothetical protein [Rhodospirillales bacterium]